MIEDLTIADYIGSHHYLQVLQEKLPQAQFFKVLNRSMTNIFTEQITEVVMKKNKQQQVFLSDSPIVSIGSRRLNDEIEDFDEQTLRKVNIQLLPLDWVYVSKQRYSDLFRLIKFSEEKYQGSFLMEMMFKKFWKQIRMRIAVFCFFPYLLYFMCAIAYLILMLYQDDEQALYWGMYQQVYLSDVEFKLFPFFCFGLVYHFAIELNQMCKSGLYKYFGQLSNYIDLLSYFFNAYVLTARTLSSPKVDVLEADDNRMSRLRIAGAFAALLLWLQLIYWLRLFGQFAKYLELIENTLVDIGYFVIILVGLILGFGSAFYLLQIERIYRGVNEEDDLQNLLLPLIGVNILPNVE